MTAGFILFLGYTAYTTVVFAIAESQAQSGSIDRAIALSPNNAKYYLERDEPGDLETAARLAPATSTPHLRMALAAESEGNKERALGLLQTAARLDRGFAPRWALANLHFRNQDWPAFWKAAREAATVYEGDLTALYRLCLHAGASGGEIYERVTPPRSKAVRELVTLLLAENRVNEAITPAVFLAGSGKETDKNLLFDYCDRLLEAREVDSAARLWSALPRFGPAGGRCFEWRHRPADGVSALRLAESALQMELTGRQADEAVLVRRYVVVKPGRHYRLRYRVHHGSDSVVDALTWVWNGKPAPDSVRREQVDLRSDGHLGELQLVARRAAGRRRPEGAFELDRIAIEPVVIE